MKQLSLKANMLWNSFGSLFYSGCQWLVTVMVVRLSTSYEAAGILAVAMAVSNVFAQIALYRMRSFQVSDIHEEISSGEYVAARFVTIGIGFIITCIYMVLTCSPSAFLATILYLIYRAGDIFIDVLHGVDQQHYRMDYCGKSMTMRAAVSTIGFCLVLKLTDSLELAIAAMIITTYPVIAYDVRCSSRLSSVKPEFDMNTIVNLLKCCLPAVIGMSLCSLVVSFARQYLGSAQGDSSLGIYASICTPIVIIQACANYVYAPLLGVFAKDVDEHNRPLFIKHLLGVLAALIGIFLMGAIAFSIFGDGFIGLIFGERLVPYGYLMYAGLLCSSLTACVAFLGDLLIALRDMRGNLIANVIGCIVSFPVSVAMVNAFDMNGVSYSISISYVVTLTVMALRIARTVRQIPGSDDE